MGFRFNPRPFRWLALAGMIAVLWATLSSFLTRNRERAQPRPAPEPIAPQISQQTEAFTLSKTSGDHTLYTVRASKVTHFKDKVVLNDVSILLYGKEGDRHDVIETQECEYDPASKSLAIAGEVTMRLGIPPADSARKREDTAPGQDPDSVSIVTTGLMFDQTTGVVSTGSLVRFQFAQGRGTARGALYDPGSQQLTLRSAVHFLLSEPGAPDGGTASIARTTPGTNSTPTDVRAASLRFRRGDSVVYLAGPVELTSGSRTLRAGESEILLDESRQARRVRLEQGVVGVDRSDGQSADVHARRGLLELSDRGRLSSLHLEENVEWSTSAADSRLDSRPLRQGRAQDVRLFFSQPAGILERIVAVRNVQMVLRDARDSPSQPARTARTRGQTFGVSGAASAGAETQTLSAAEVEMTISPDGKVLQSVTARPDSTLDLAPFNPDEQRWRITGQEFRMSFDGAGNLTQFAAERAVRVIAEPQRGPADRRLSTSDHLSATLDPRTRSVSRIEQLGHYQYQDSGKQARADRAEYSGNGDAVTLSGEGSVWNSTGKLSASRITMGGSSGEVQAEGNVSTTFLPAASPGMDETNPIHAVADRLQYDSTTGKAQYEGRVRLWQGSNLLQADRVDLDRKQRQMEASGKVYSVMLQQASDLGASSKRSQSAPPGSAEAGAPAEIRSMRMVYQEGERRAVYQGKTSLRSASSTVSAEQLEIFLIPAGLVPAGASTGDSGGAQIEHAVATGEVVILDSQRNSKRESGRRATADRAEYFPGQDLFRLYGKPAAVWDPQRGSTQGVRLTYRVADDRILVEGEPGLPAETRRQVQR
jgi:lipopolysaccharide export system protein LptA